MEKGEERILTLEQTSMAVPSGWVVREQVDIPQVIQGRSWMCTSMESVTADEVTGCCSPGSRGTKRALRTRTTR